MNFMTEISQYTLITFNNLLVSATAEGSTDNVLTRLSAMSADEITAAKADKGLYDSAMVIYNALPLFRNIIKEAEGITVSDASDDTIPAAESYAEAKAYYEGNEEKLAEDMSDTQKFAVLVMLKGTEYGGTTLYDVLMNESAQIQELYPLVSAMNKSQIAGVKLMGMYSVFSVIGSADGVSLTADDIRAVHANDKADVISAYYGVDRSIITGKVAVTSAATAEMNSSGERSPLWGNLSSGAEMALAVSAGVAAGVAVASLIVVASQQIQFCGSMLKLSFYKNLFAYTMDVVKPGELLDIFVRESHIVGFRTGFQTTYEAVESYAAVSMYAALIVAVIISATLLVLELVNYYNIEHKEIPTVALDLTVKDGVKTYIRYNAVTSPDGETMGDLNGGVGLKWNAVYVTKDPAAGKPLLAKTAAFTDKTNPGTQYIALHNFASDAAVNLNNYTYSDKTAIRLYFAADNSYSLSTGSVFDSTASVAAITGAAGIIIGAAVTFFAMRKKKKAPAAV